MEYRNDSIYAIYAAESHRTGRYGEDYDEEYNGEDYWFDDEEWKES